MDQKAWHMGSETNKLILPPYSVREFTSTLQQQTQDTATLKDKVKIQKQKYILKEKKHTYLLVDALTSFSMQRNEPHIYSENNFVASTQGVPCMIFSESIYILHTQRVGKEIPKIAGIKKTTKYTKQKHLLNNRGTHISFESVHTLQHSHCNFSDVKVHSKEQPTSRPDCAQPGQKNA